MPAINSVLVNASKTRRPNAVSLDYLTAFTPGPVDIGDTSLGPVNRPWRCRVDNAAGKVYIAKANDGNTDWLAETELFSFTGVPCLELDVSFEQAARPVVVMERATGVGGASEIWLYWFKPADSDFVFEVIAEGKTPRVILDYPYDTSISDVLLFYLNDSTGLVYRQQRDLYAIELTTPITDSTNLFLEEIAYLNNWRIGVFFSQTISTTGHFSLRHLETTMYPVPVKDDKIGVSLVLSSGELLIIVISYSMFDIDQLQVGLTLQSGALVTPIIFHTLFDIDQLQVGLSVQSGILVLAIILHTLFDKDPLKVGLTVQSGILAVVVVEHSLYDKDPLKVGFTLQSGTLV